MILLVCAVRLLVRNDIASETLLELFTYLYAGQQSYWYNRAAEKRMQTEGRRGEERVRNSMQLVATFERLGLLVENERIDLAVEMAGGIEEREAEEEDTRRERGEGEGGVEGELREETQREGKRVALHARRMGRGAGGAAVGEGEGGELDGVGLGLGLDLALWRDEVAKLERERRRRRRGGRRRRRGGESAKERGEGEER